MSFAKVTSAQSFLLKAHPISIEVDISKGIHSFTIVGLPDKAVEESKDRISAAIKNSGFKSPKSKNEKVVIALAPADIKKEGPVFDLGMAIGYLIASGDIQAKVDQTVFLGELSLDGIIRPIKGALPLTSMAQASGFSSIIMPKENIQEASCIQGISIYGAHTLKEVIDHVEKVSELQKSDNREFSSQHNRTIPEIDMSEIRGQENAKRGLEIAAAGGHNIALYGPPGTGKSMLAKAFSGILPPLSFEDMLEVTSIHSIAGVLTEHLITEAPFRAPHHTSSYVAVIGGGTNPRPGEATLAHKGVLFLDEFPEFDRRVIESLRQPLEDKVISIARAKGSAIFPAHFLLIAAMNPCPCGNYGFRGKPCTCNPVEIQRYKKKLSGPIVERIDIWLEVERIQHEKLTDESLIGENSLDIRSRVAHARLLQSNRLKHSLIKTNGAMSAKELAMHITLTNEAKEILNKSAQTLHMSPRVYHKIIKIAQTIADLSGESDVSSTHILEALQYRPRERR